jgi:aspartyl-tRNA(Asn)/glutamyl-tRNA(Gln) amidotransferase subunit A
MTSGAHAPDTALAIAADVRAGRRRARDIVARALARIDATNARLNALCQVFGPEALARAAHIDALVASGQDPGPLAGVPVAIKDNICTTLGYTTCASRFLEHYRSPFDATVVQRLLDAGAVIVGKANLDEFAMGSSTESSAHGPTRNPWDVGRVPGGSSGGSAAAVAAGMVPLALGSDTGGSIRQPASHCGVVGLKPTYGRVSRSGLVAYASSLDQIGPITTTVHDAALAARVLCGHDPLDSTSAPVDVPDFVEQIDHPLTHVTIGVPAQARSASNHPSVAITLDDALRALQDRGARVVDIDLPHADFAIAAYYLIATAEASSNLARFDGVRFGRRATLAPGATLEDLYKLSRSQGFGPEVQKRIMLGTYALSAGYYDAYYARALKARRLIKQDYDRAFAAGVTAILMPASPGPAFRLGEKTADPLAMYLEDVYTVGVNLAGLPAISVPAGLDHSTGTPLPIGLQLVGPALGEVSLLRVAHMLHQAAGFAAHAPV